MKKTVLIVIYTFAVGLVLQGWLSRILPVSQKILLTVAALVLIAGAFALQTNWHKHVR